jgi:hypothetical protein
MDRIEGTQRSHRTDRRRFLKQIAATSAMAGVAAIPVIAAEKTGQRLLASKSDQASLDEVLASYAITLGNEHELNLCELEIVLKSGARNTIRVEYHRGHWKNAMTDAEMEEKFRSLARKHLWADRVDNLLHQLWTLDDLPRADSLIAATLV